MKAKLIFTFILLLSTSLRSVLAQGFWDERFDFDPHGDYFNANEWRIDLGAVWGSHDRKHFKDDRWGFGFGGNYFFNRYFGAEAETYIDRWEAPNHVDFSAVGRYPLPNIALAPYALAGFGRQFDDVEQWTTHIGVGLDFRFNRATGLFTDLRRVFAEESRDLTVFRIGLRFGL